MANTSPTSRRSFLQKVATGAAVVVGTTSGIISARPAAAWRCAGSPCVCPQWILMDSFCSNTNLFNVYSGYDYNAGLTYFCRSQIVLVCECCC